MSGNYFGDVRNGFGKNNNSYYISKMQSAFGTGPAKNNYRANQKTNQNN
jgi:hypothetical protein